MTSICDFCERDRVLVIVHESKRYAHAPTICSSCVWRCAAKLVEHSQAARNVPDLDSPAPMLRVIAEDK